MSTGYPASLLGPEVEALQTVFVARYVSLAGYATLLFDLVLTLPHEISVVWPANWSIVKVLFLTTRYTVPPLITATMIGVLGVVPLNISYCRTLAKLVGWYQLAALAVLNAIVSLRIHAQYDRRLWILLTLAGLFVLTYAAAIALEAHYLGQVSAPSVGYISTPQFQMCYATAWDGLWSIWLPATLFECVLWSLTAYKTWEHWYVRRVSLRAALAGDGFFYHTCTLTSRLLALLLWRFSTSNTLRLLGVSFTFCLVTVAGSRMMLYLPSVRKVEQWDQSVVTQHDSIDSSAGWEMAPDVSLRRPRANLWLANQGGRSFLEQVYETTRGTEAEVRPTVLFMDKFTSSK